jgi:hypothetical protein
MFLALVTLPMLVQAAEHDNRLYLTVGEITENRQVELSLHLVNPSTSLTAVELYLTLPEGATLSAGSRTTRATNHTLTEGTTDKGHFVSLASAELATFTGTDGVLCTWSVDLSSLATGDYDITASGLFAVGLADGAVTAYTAEEQTLHIVSTPTGVAAPSSSCGTLTIYNMQGQRLNAPQKGQINIVNGKKILLK